MWKMSGEEIDQATEVDVDPNNDRRMVPTPRYSPLPSSATTLATPTMTLSASPVLLKDDFTFESSTDVAAALAAMSWKQTALERDGRDLTSFLAISSGSSSTSSDEDDDHYYGPVISSPSPSPVVENVSRNLRIRHSRVPSSSHKSPQPKFPAVSRNNGSRFSGSEEEEDEEDEDEEDDDNIPLAKRIPGAITAQKCIRRQVLQERGSEKQEKALRDHSETSRSRLMTLRPGALPSNLHDAAATRAASQTTLQRISRTFLRNGSRSLNPFSREDSARRLPSTHRSKSKEKSLRDVHPTTETLPPLQIPQIRTTTPIDATSLYQHSLHHAKSMTKSLRDVPPPSTTEVLPPVPIPPPSSHTQRPRSVKESPSQPYQYHTSPSPTPINSSYAPSLMAPLRAMRSFHFHRPSIDYRSIVGMDDPRSVPLPSDAEKIISQNSTNVARSRPSTRDGPRQQTSTFPSATPAHHHRSLSRSRSAIEPTLAITIPEPVPPIPLMAMISQEAERQSRSTLRQHRPAQSLSSPAESLAMIGSKPELVVQQRVFIGNMQRFNMVEINESTTAGDIIEMIEAEGSFTDIAGIGGWMVFEIAQDFGMERPIRSFELVVDVQASWNKAKMVNYLVLRMTPLEVPLNPSAIPSSSPTHSGYVEWEAKRGKWSKRFMQLREHSIWISKQDTGRDQVQLCSLSNFDAYRITRKHRAPKPFAFAVKSTDNLSLFENTADYFHSFACSEREGKIWMEIILVARSYVLFQERHVLYNPKSGGGNASGVSRSGARKATIQRSTGN